MPKKPMKDDSAKLDTIIGLLQHTLAIELFKSGVTQDVIAKHLHVAKAAVVRMVKNVRRDDENVRKN